jgi:SHS2 domain-containing protein
VYRWVDHTSEVELEIEAVSEREVFEEALRALGELLADDPRGHVRRRVVDVAAADRPTLLADWLGELVFLAEAESFLAERVVALQLEDARVVATLEGRTAAPRHLVKAVTYHRLALAERDGLWRARVVLDV